MILVHQEYLVILVHQDQCLTSPHGWPSCPSLKAEKRALNLTHSVTCRHKLGPSVREEPMVLLDHLDHKVSKVLGENLENLVLLDLREQLDQEACPAYQEKMETMETMDQLGHQVSKDHQDHAACQVCLVYQEQRATVVSQV